ncbi:hypothetical protein KY290_006644 [Solanum tuberosum]|uniref:Threonine dehydratase n=1 Tax=Solanum tuberosum TaxID=4113 RepID=A0ABQ7WHK9_SOLTU|nr:PREDICTED: threonine dehydratase biosynthetic, chloroplastic-like [Solanum tuberosum]KAH0723019.1 hypothetical protein KY289_006063 [Solanum tuberosum]KAH0780217.1 hypothetical protein KY290_006644 [Solanum tuberosum]
MASPFTFVPLTITSRFSRPNFPARTTAINTCSDTVKIANNSKTFLISPLPVASLNSLRCDPGYLIPNYPVGGNGGDSGFQYLINILGARVYDVAHESPLQLAPKLSQKLGVNVWLKREDLQPVSSFNLRGAYNMMAKLSEEELKRGAICSSAGNHAQGVALASHKLGCNAIIVMPVTTPEIKSKSAERLGGNVVLMGDVYDESQAYAKKRAEVEGRTFIPPFDHPDVIAGQGTIGMEINRQLKDKIHAIFVPVGGGGLIAGIAAYMKRVAPDVKIIGVEPCDANAMAMSLHYGHRVILDQVGNFADGVAVKVVGEETFRLCKELIDGVVLVNRDAICVSIKDMFEEKRSILEPAGALALAGAEAYCKYYGLKDENVVAITSGANMNFDRLRLISQLADAGRNCEAVLATCMPEEPGSFKRFCKQIGPTMKFIEFKYRYDSRDEKALVLYRVAHQTKSELEALIEKMRSAKLHTVNLTDNDLVKDHSRHLTGGRSNLHNELLCRFTFPKKAGALSKTIDAFSLRWNISLIHYRAQGHIGANVLVGIQVPQDEFDEFQDCARRLGYKYVLKTIK